jgi:Mrp family chromosome partitioning ATPase
VPVEVSRGSMTNLGISGTTAGVLIATATPLAPLHAWRRVGREYDGVVLVAETGSVDRADLQELRSILAAAEARVLAVVLTSRRRSRGGPADADRNGPPAPAQTPRPSGVSGDGAALVGR